MTQVLQDIDSKKDAEWDRLLVELDSARSARAALPVATPRPAAIGWSSARDQGDAASSDAALATGTADGTLESSAPGDISDEGVTGQLPVDDSDMIESDDAALLSVLHTKIMELQLAQQVRPQLHV